MTVLQQGTVFQQQIRMFPHWRRMDLMGVDGTVTL